MHDFVIRDGADVCSRCGCERRIRLATQHPTIDGVSEYRVGTARTWVRSAPPCVAPRMGRAS